MFDNWSTKLVSISLGTLWVLLIGCSGIEGTDGSRPEAHTQGKFERKLQLTEGVLDESDRKIIVSKGDTVRLVFTSNDRVMLHLHGYDIEKTVPAEGSAVIEFLANATGRFNITAHGSSQVKSHENHHASEKNSHDHTTVNYEQHGALFESNTLYSGDTFSFTVDRDMPDMTVHYHDHMSHDDVGRIVVDSNRGQEGIINVGVSEGEVKFGPSEVFVQPGSTVVWTVGQDDKVRLTSGLPPESGHDTDSDQEERILTTIEVHP